MKATESTLSAKTEEEPLERETALVSPPLRHNRTTSAKRLPAMNYQQGNL